MSTNKVEHLYRARYQVQMPHICTGWCYQPVQMFSPPWALFPSHFLLFSFLISSHPALKSQILQVSNQDSITKFTTSSQIIISTHHITYYINLIYLIKFSQQHNNQDSQELTITKTTSSLSLTPWGRARPTTRPAPCRARRPVRPPTPRRTTPRRPPRPAWDREGISREEEKWEGKKEEKETWDGKEIRSESESGGGELKGEGREGEARAKKFLSPRGINGMTFVPGHLFTWYKCRHIYTGWCLHPVQMWAICTELGGGPDAPLWGDICTR
jgi:hypothetical protein